MNDEWEQIDFDKITLQTDSGTVILKCESNHENTIWIERKKGTSLFRRAKQTRIKGGPGMPAFDGVHHEMPIAALISAGEIDFLLENWEQELTAENSKSVLDGETEALAARKTLYEAAKKARVQRLTHS